MNAIDTTGLKCPQPLIKVKEALQKMEAGAELTIYTDNDTSLKNLVAFLKDQGVDPGVTTAGNVHTILTTRPEENMSNADPSVYCETHIPFIDYVVCIKSELMGEGDPELGKLLMETFVDNLKLQEKLPTHVVMYNGGVKLAMKQSQACSSLSELEQLGTRIMLCGTCIDHYGLQYDIGVGMISNMVVITETLASAGHVLYP